MRKHVSSALILLTLAIGCERAQDRATTQPNEPSDRTAADKETKSEGTETDRIWTYAEVLANKDKKVLTRETAEIYIAAIVDLAELYEVEPLTITSSVASTHDSIQNRGAPLDCLEIMHEMRKGHSRFKSLRFEWTKALTLWSASWVAMHGKSENEVDER